MYDPENKKGNYDYLINVNNKKFEENKKLQIWFYTPSFHFSL